MDMGSLAPDVAIASTVQLAAAGDEVAFARIVAARRAEMVRVAYVVSGDWDWPRTRPRRLSGSPGASPPRCATRPASGRG